MAHQIQGLTEGQEARCLRTGLLSKVSQPPAPAPLAQPLPGSEPRERDNPREQVHRSPHWGNGVARAVDPLGDGSRAVPEQLAGVKHAVRVCGGRAPEVPEL